MLQMDDRLQLHLEALEAGQPLEEVLGGLSAAEGELVPLLRLAARVRQVRHPLPQRVFRPEAQIQRLRQRQPKRAAGSWQVRNLLMAAGVVGAAAFLFACLAALAAFSVWYVGPYQGRFARLIEVEGQVRAASARQDNWAPVSTGQTVRAGQRLRTGAASSVTLVFSDGSRAVLLPGCEVTLRRLTGTWERTIQMEMVQHSGSTSHSVMPMGSRTGEYQVQTSSGTATVHGTVFSVAVEPGGPARFAVERGQVAVAAQTGEVLLAAGQSTFIQPGKAPAAPAYQFALSGALDPLTDEEWMVNGVAFRITESTSLEGSLQTAQHVQVTGRRLADGTLVADQLAVTEEGTEEAQFTGLIESMQGEVWRIGGQDVLVNAETKLDEGLVLGVPVRVVYRVLEDRRWLALEIEALVEEQPITGTPQPRTELPVGTITPTVAITPTATMTPTLTTDCTGANPQPKGRTLAEKYGVPYEEIMGWFCQRFGFGEIDLAYELSRAAGVDVELIFDLRRSGLGWGEIKKMVKDGLVTPTPLPTEPPLVTTEPPPAGTEPPPLPTEPVVTPSPYPEPVDPCTGANPQPKGQTLASKYGVSYDTIMRWFCQGFGFGEIDLAYGLSRQSGVPVEQIFAMRQSGLGWGEIKKQLDPKPVKTKKP